MTTTPLPDGYTYGCVRGNDLPMAVQVTGMTNFLANTLNGLIYANFYSTALSLPVLLTVANGGVSNIDTVNDILTFSVGKLTTIGLASSGQTRLEVLFADPMAGGAVKTLDVYQVYVTDPRTDQDVITGQIAILPVLTVSVNGHTGMVQNLTAADVGAYTTAQADNSAMVQALIYGG